MSKMFDDSKVTIGVDQFLSFKYPSLDPALRSIRLVRLLARSSIGKPDGKWNIQCELTHSYLDNPKHYDAVSYCWGTEEWQKQRSRSITLDGKRFMVSPIVEDLLIRLHDPFGDVLLWIDLICIDQESLTDKTLQVSRMPDIFRNARSVIASLGPHSSSLGLSHSVARDILPTLRSAALHGKASVLTTDKRLSFSEMTDYYMLCFLQHPWFTRVWVVQEMAHAKNVRILGGNSETLSGQEFITGLEYYMRYSQIEQNHPVRTAKTKIEPLLQLIAAESSVASFDDLAFVLQDFRPWEATLPCDKVFALIGLCSSQWAMQADYRLSLKQVLLNTALKAIENNSSLHVLSYREPWTLAKLADMDFVSWAPDWTETRYDLGAIPKSRLRPRAPPPFRTWASQYHGLDAKLRNACQYFVATARATGVLKTWGHQVGLVTSVFNDGSIEFKPNVVHSDPSGMVLQRVSEHLTRLHCSLRSACGSGLQVGDHICVLRGCTGPAILRPVSHRGTEHAQFRLVKLEHSVYNRYGSVWDMTEAHECRYLWTGSNGKIAQEYHRYLRKRRRPLRKTNKPDFLYDTFGIWSTFDQNDLSIFSIV